MMRLSTPVMVCTCALAFLWSTAFRRFYSRSSARCERLLLDSDFFLMRPCILPWPFCSQRVARGGLGCRGKTDLPRSPTATSRGATSPNNAPFSSFSLEPVRGIECFTSAALDRPPSWRPRSHQQWPARMATSIARNPRRGLPRPPSWRPRSHHGGTAQMGPPRGSRPLELRQSSWHGPPRPSRCATTRCGRSS